MSNSFDDRWDRDVEREPSYARPRPIIALNIHGTVKTRLGGTSPCSSCKKPTAGLTCRECQRRAAMRLHYGCFTCSGCGNEVCTCEEAK